MNGNFKNLTPPTTRPSMRHSAAPQSLSTPKLAPNQNAAMAAFFRYKSDQKLVFSYDHCRTQLRTGRTPSRTVQLWNRGTLPRPCRGSDTEGLTLGRRTTRHQGWQAPLWWVLGGTSRTGLVSKKPVGFRLNPQ